MVTLQAHSESNEYTLLMMPNRSVDWETNKKVIAAIGAFSIGIALAATLILGAWPILPFAGIEITAVAIALYYVSWKLNYRQVVRLSEQWLCIEKGVYYPKQSWRWPRHSVTLVLGQATHYLDGKTLALQYQQETVELGEFLNPEERQEAIDHLVQLRLAVRYRN